MKLSTTVAAAIAALAAGAQADSLISLLLPVNYCGNPNSGSVPGVIFTTSESGKCKSLGSGAAAIEVIQGGHGWFCDFYSKSNCNGESDEIQNQGQGYCINSSIGWLKSARCTWNGS
ncbi:hypothetical protein CONLIGDRAFT_679045 [Coniochaeta ligniaria NRRL 30616]|uniref:Uncharacterized protein n=1 Tax=Coniochaeta ligniaria NRRL 30616 TaxID=1408157 RepID=A0A1J7IZR6_9PEZI|nr:hypothetical protein CONLIGDRAFT_679045 [Coniochaeta ligniaria NRRL 30616]